MPAPDDLIKRYLTIGFRSRECEAKRSANMGGSAPSTAPQPYDRMADGRRRQLEIAVDAEVRRQRSAEGAIIRGEQPPRLVDDQPARDINTMRRTGAETD